MDRRVLAPVFEGQPRSVSSGDQDGLVCLRSPQRGKAMGKMLLAHADHFALDLDRHFVRNLGSVAQASWALEDERVFYLSDHHNAANGWVSILQAVGLTVFQGSPKADDLCSGYVFCDSGFWTRNAAILEELRYEMPAIRIVVLTGTHSAAIPSDNGSFFESDDIESMLASAGIGFFAMKGLAKC